MTKKIKTLSIAVFTLLLTLCCIVMGACNGGNDNEKGDDKIPENAFAVTVVLEDTQAPVVDISIIMCEIGGKGACMPAVKTNDKGVAYIDVSTLTTEKAHLRIKKNAIPEGYVYADKDGNPYPDEPSLIGVISGAEVTVADKAYTIVLKKA